MDKGKVYRPDQHETYHDFEYLNLVADVLENGIDKPTRTGTDTLSVFSRQMRFDLSDGSIPLLTTKKMHLKSIIHELLWYLMGDTNVKYLQDNGVRIWNEWADKNGDLGPVYGEQWRKWKHAVGAEIDYQSDPSTAVIKYKYIDQIESVINQLLFDPESRRMIVSAWNVGELREMALPPCHYTFQFFYEPFNFEHRFAMLSEKIGSKDANGMLEASDHVEATFHKNGIRRGKVSCMLNQRSCDVGLGVPFNIASYALMTMMLAQVCDLHPGYMSTQYARSLNVEKFIQVQHHWATRTLAMEPN